MKTFVSPLRIACYAILSLVTGVVAQTRDPWLEPFHENSIWNHPIGAGASLVPAGLQDEYISLDEEILVRTNWSDPSQEIRTPGSWHVRWPGSPAWWLGRIHVPNSLIVADANPPQTPNNCSAFLMPDNATVTELSPLTRVVAGAHVVGYRSPNTYLYGMGMTGSHAGSGLSALGGSIRVHEWGQNKNITHAIKVNLFAMKYLHWDGVRGHRWPANREDGYAATVYGGSNSALRMGSLLTLPQGATYSTVGGLTTWQAKKLFDAIYRYGAYVVDDTAWNSHGICVEKGVSMPLEQVTFQAEVNRIFKALRVVNNNSASNIGGGGTLRAARKVPLGPPLGARITLQSRANLSFVTAENAGSSPLIANRTLAGWWENFEVVAGGSGSVCLRAPVNGRYVAVQPGTGLLVATATSITSAAQFDWESHDGGASIALKSRANGLYVAAENGGSAPLVANRLQVGLWEKFIPGGGTGSWTEYGASEFIGRPGQ